MPGMGGKYVSRLFYAEVNNVIWGLRRMKPKDSEAGKKSENSLVTWIITGKEYITAVIE